MTMLRNPPSPLQNYHTIITLPLIAIVSMIKGMPNSGILALLPLVCHISYENMFIVTYSFQEYLKFLSIKNIKQHQMIGMFACSFEVCVKLKLATKSVEFQDKKFWETVTSNFWTDGSNIWCQVFRPRFLGIRWTIVGIIWTRLTTHRDTSSVPPPTIAE